MVGVTWIGKRGLPASRANAKSPARGWEGQSCACATQRSSRCRDPLLERGSALPRCDADSSCAAAQQHQNTSRPCCLELTGARARTTNARRSTESERRWQSPRREFTFARTCGACQTCGASDSAKPKTANEKACPIVASTAARTCGMRRPHCGNIGVAGRGPRTRPRAWHRQWCRLRQRFDQRSRRSPCRALTRFRCRLAFRLRLPAR